MEEDPAPVDMLDIPLFTGFYTPGGAGFLPSTVPMLCGVSVVTRLQYFSIPLLLRFVNLTNLQPETRSTLFIMLVVLVV